VSTGVATVVQLVIGNVLGVGDHGVLPLALVIRVIDHARGPRTLELGIVDRRCLPLTILLIIPIIRLDGLRVGNCLRSIVVALRLDILRIGDFLSVYPVGGLGDLGVPVSVVY